MIAPHRDRWIAHALLALLLAAHLPLGLDYGRYPPDDPRSDRSLIVYNLATHALLVVWCLLDAKASGRRLPWWTGIATLVFGWFGAMFHVLSTRTAGQRFRALVIGFVYFIVCIGIFEEAFQHAFASWSPA